MSLTTIISSAQQRSKDSYAASATVGLCLRSNGEETVKVIDAKGRVFLAGITPPTVAPTVADSAAGTLTNGKWVAYAYVYASTLFPFVETDNAIDGKLYPRSNASPASTGFQVGVTGGVVAGARALTVTVTKTTTTEIDVIWVFRTALFASLQEAETAAAAGQMFFSTELVNDGIAGTTSYVDDTLLDSADQVQSDNYVAPQFQFCVFYDPYWWGFGNLPFQAAASWDNSHTAATAKITLTGTDTWFDGRNGQNVTLDGITTGGFDGAGTFKFLWLTSTTATLTLDGVTPVALPSTGTGNVLIQGVATTLYRSKVRNPFAWGLTQTIGDVIVPQLYAFKVGGGLGTALATVPNNPTLKLDTEYPTSCYTLNLRSAGMESFEGTLRRISDVYSVTAHFSQFAAVTQSGESVLWGIDFKNFAILQCDGVTQIPISGPIPKMLRSLTVDRSRQLFSHGVYDPQTELNCLWVSSVAGLSLVNTLIYCHAPTGFWGFSNDLDVLSSASIQDTLTGARKTFVGTQTGIFGQALVPNVWSNWLPNSGVYTGTIESATGTTITIPAESGFNTSDDGIIGNWCLLTDADGQQEQWARISDRSTFTLTFDWIRSLVGGGTAAFNPVPAAGWKFFIGLIECELLKYFDFNLPQTDKRLMEIWLTQQGVDTASQGTIIRFYRERANTYTQFASLQNVYADDGESDAWYQKNEIPSELVKMFGLKFINRGYQQWKFINLILKPNIVP